MSTGLFTLRKAFNVFGTSPEEMASRAISERSLPQFARGSDNRTLKSWSYLELPHVGEKIGYMAKPNNPHVVAMFVTKGGVLKSSLTLNLARTAALHNIRTCVVGLDMQGDITSALSLEDANDESTSLEDAIARMNSLRGLADVFTGDATLKEVLKPTDLPSLWYIPETPELVALDQSLVNRNRREYWLRDQVVGPLKKDFDLIIMDCSPNWNRLITNALIACDTLISPLECKINNFRNFKTFQALLNEFQSDMNAKFNHVYVPTRLNSGRKLSQEIYSWYRNNLSSCVEGVVKESVQGEESVAVRQSVPEYAPTSQAADEMRDLLKEIWERVSSNESLRASSERMHLRTEVSI
jgi:chromosome partitioning protein